MGVFNVMAGKGPGPGGGSAIVPETPTLTRAVLTNTTAASISFIAPAYNGGNPIKSYTAVSTPGSISGTVNQSGSGSVTVSGLTSGTAYTFIVYATNDIGNSANSASSGNANSEFGEATFTVAGANTWTVPANVTSVSIVMVGGGGSGGGGYGSGGGGAALTYINNLSVVPGNTYNLFVGAGGTSATRVGSASWFSNSIFLYAGGGNGGFDGPGTSARTVGGGGGAAGYSGNGGVGGGNTAAGGYSGGTGGTGGGLVPGLVTYTGGTGGISILGSVKCGPAGAGVGGSGAGGAGGYNVGCGGGGVSYLGQSSVDNNGNPTTPGAATNAGVSGANTFNGGSGGNSAISVGISTQFKYNGVRYGSGGGGLNGVTSGGPGFVRIVWPGDVRQYPNTMVKNAPSY